MILLDFYRVVFPPQWRGRIAADMTISGVSSMKKFLCLALCLCLLSLLCLSGCGSLFGASSASEPSAVEDSSSAPESSLPPESSEPEPEFPAEPTLQTAGARIEEPGDLLDRVNEFANLCCLTGKNFEWDTLSDNVIAACGMLLCAGDEHLTQDEDGLIRLDAVYFDQAVMDYFGRPIEDVSVLVDRFPSYKNGQYFWYPSGIIMPYQFKGETAYDLGGGYVRIEGYAYHEDPNTGEPTDVTDAVYIVLQNPASPYGFNMIAEQFG